MNEFHKEKADMNYTEVIDAVVNYGGSGWRWMVLKPDITKLSV